MGSSSSSAVIKAPVASVWEVLHDVEAVKEWQPDMKSAECLEYHADGRPMLVLVLLDTVIRRTEVTLAIDFDDDAGIMRWEKHTGDVPGFVGSWTVEAVSARRTRVDYSLEINFGRFGKLVRGPMAAAVNGAASSSMPGKLKEYVEGIVSAGRAGRAISTS